MYFLRDHRLVLPVLIASLAVPLMVSPNAAYAHSYYPPIVEKHLPSQKLVVSSEAAMPVLTRDTITTVAPAHVFEGRSVGAVNGDIVATAKQFIGVPYVANSADPNVGFDCSGFVMHVFGLLGVQLPHNANVQGQIGTRVPMSEAIPGDLLVWEGHVAIYVGEGMMIDSAKPGTSVNIRPIWGEPYVSRLT